MIPSSQPGTVATERLRWRPIAAGMRNHRAEEIDEHARDATVSPPFELMRRLLSVQGREIAPKPLLHKQMPGALLRLFFRVESESGVFDGGDIVAIVALHDMESRRTLYAHPVHAAAVANPLFTHLEGPMSSPRAQPGELGERATRRMLEHKRAIWSQHLRERVQLGEQEACSLWRERYEWALLRLYFCERCPGCRWGSPFFPDGQTPPWRPERAPAEHRFRPMRLPSRQRELVSEVVASTAFGIERAYASRGGFLVSMEPCLVGHTGPGHALVLFPTSNDHLDAGSIVMLAATHDLSSRSTLLVHTLSAGPEPELPLFDGRRALGLPPVGIDSSRRAHAAWRVEAWTRFWLDELEVGLHAASRTWLRDYLRALARLVGPSAVTATPVD